MLAFVACGFNNDSFINKLTYAVSGFNLNSLMCLTLSISLTRSMNIFETNCLLFLLLCRTHCHYNEADKCIRRRDVRLGKG